MAYTQAAEEARIIVNLDFSLVIPAGTYYQTNLDKLPDTINDVPAQAKVVLDLVAPKPVRTGTDFNDPLTRGVIRNYTAGLFIDRYGVDVKQETALSSRYAIAIYALKTNRNGTGYFVIVTARGLYEGRAVIPGKANKERLQMLRQILSTLTPYESTPSEIDAVRIRAENERKEQERRRRLEEEAASKRSKAQLAKADEKEVQEKQEKEDAAVIEADILLTGAEAQTVRTDGSAMTDEKTNTAVTTDSVTADAETDKPTEPAIAEEQAQAGITPELAIAEEQAQAGSTSEPVTEQEQTQTGSTPESVTTEGQAQTDNTAETAAADGQTRTDFQENGTGEDDGATEMSEEQQQERIAALEEKRRQHLADLRARFAGNPQVESGIDNYIARVDRTGDEVVAAFRKFLRGVQEYASAAAFTGENDPNYINMLKGVREEETNLGRKLDALLRSVDKSVQDAVDAGVTEAYIERMIRMIERSRAKYDKLAVSMNGRDRIAYLIPADVSGIVTKWQKFRQKLPSQLEETDKRREQEISIRIQNDILEKRSSFASCEEAVETARQQMIASQSAASQARNIFETFEKDYGKQRENIESVHHKQLQSNEDAIAALNDELSGHRDEVEKLNDELSHTFALNRGRKKDLSAKIQELNSRITECEMQLTQLQDAAGGFETQASRELSDLEARREELRTAADNSEQQSEDMEKAYETAQEDFEQMKEDLAREEEEWKHVHENFLAGKYDEQDQ